MGYLCGECGREHRTKKKLKECHNSSYVKSQREIVANCKNCGEPITRASYVGYPFCDKCRAEYKKRKQGVFETCMECGKIYSRDEGIKRNYKCSVCGGDLVDTYEEKRRTPR